jgi:uncharacterized protein (TIGR02145 family)
MQQFNKQLCILYLFISFTQIGLGQQLITDTIYSKQDTIGHIEDWIKELKDTVIDIDSNYYHTHKIGNQIWMVENLKTTKFNDGRSVFYAQDSSQWIHLSKPGYCKLIGREWWSTLKNDTTANDDLYFTDIPTKEILYNSYVITDTCNICPKGWHIPTPNDWTILQACMDTINTLFTINYYVKGFNVGFTSLPLGYRSGYDAQFDDYGDFGYWWSTVPTIIASAWARILNRGFGIDDIHTEKVGNHSAYGYSIKCIKNK